MKNNVYSLLVYASLGFLTLLTGQEVNKTDILKQMKQFGFSDEVTAEAMGSSASLKTILTLRKLQEAGFSDAIYIAIINRAGEYSEEQMQELIDLKHSGFADNLIVAALPESNASVQSLSGESVVLNKPKGLDYYSAKVQLDDVSSKSKKTSDHASLFFPDKSANFALTVLGDFENQDFSDDMDVNAFGIRYFNTLQTTETKGLDLSINTFIMLMENEDISITTTMINSYWAFNHFFVNGVKKDIAGEITNRGLTVAMGPLFGFGINGIYNTFDANDLYTTVDGTIWSGLLGGRARTEIPLMPGMLYLQGFGDLMMNFQFGTITTSTSGYIFGTSFDDESESEVSETYFTPSYAFDIVLYPSQSLPRLKLTLGSMLQIMNDEDSITMYTFGVSWASGPLYKSRSVGINVK